MEVRFNKSFRKQYKRLDTKTQKQFEQRLALFLDNPGHPLLKTHSLKAERFGLQSLNVNANYRAIFSNEGEILIFHEIGSHSQLYS